MVNAPKCLNPVDLFVKYKGKQQEIITKCCVTNPFTTLDYKKEWSSFPDNPCHGHIYEAIWDTGATGSAVNVKVVQKLGLQEIDVEVATGIGGMTIEVKTYPLVINFPQRGTYFLESVAGIEMPNDVVIGMDVIGNGDFALLNGEIFSYCSPSFHDPVKFGKQIKSHMRTKTES